MPPTSTIADLIKQLRRHQKLTQVQLAHEVGLSPATIYRYESGARPDTASLLVFANLAEKTGSTALANAFRQILAGRMESSVPSVLHQSSADGQNSPAESFAGIVARTADQLHDSQKLQVLAFLVMLRENTDATAEKMLGLLLDPWVSRAKDEFGLEASEKQHKAKKSKPSQ